MAAERQPSISASSLTSSSGRRTSTSSFQPPPLPPLISARRSSSSSSFQLPPLPPSNESLAAGTSIPAPIHSAPTPPPKDSKPTHMSLPVPVTPQRKPVQRQKSPLSNEAYFSSPAPSMPGSFPTTPPPASMGMSPNTGLQNAQFSTRAYAAGESPSPNSKSPKRPGSIRNLLSKALRKSYDKGSPDTSGFRPPSSGADSTLSSGRPSLQKKKSGSFWRRTSSMGMSFGSEGESGYQTSSPGINHGSVPEEEASIRSPTPTPNDFPTVKTRKSGTFWRRRSSMGLATAFGANGGTADGTNETTNGISRGSTNGDYNDLNGDHKESPVGDQESEKQLPDIPMSPLSRTSTTNFEELMPKRSYSPPPQLPHFVGEGSGLGGEDMFKDIH